MNRKTALILALLLIAFSAVPAHADLETSEAHLRFGTMTRPKKKTLSLDVFNRSSTPVLASVSADGDWIKPSKTEIELKPGQRDEIEFTVDSSNLAPDDYRCTITINAYFGSGDKKVIASCTVLEASNEAYLKVGVKELDLKEIERGQTPMDFFMIENAGSAILEMEISFPSWIVTESKLKLYPQQQVKLYYRALTSDMLPDRYTGDIIIRSNGGNATIPVSMTVKRCPDDPVIVTSPKMLDLGTVKKGRRARGKFKISNSGKKPYDATLTYPDYAIETVDEVKEVTKEKSILLVLNTKKLPLGVTKDTIRLTSKYGIADIPFRVNVRK